MRRQFLRSRREWCFFPSRSTAGFPTPS